MAVTVQSWAKSKAKQTFVTIKLQPCKCIQMIFKCIISAYQSSEYIWIRIIYATWTTWACRKLHNETFPDFCGLELKKRLPNALYRIAWHGALNRVPITRCKTRKGLGIFFVLNSRSPVRHKKSDLQCCCNGKECHPFAHWFFWHPFTWVFPSCICSTLSRSEMAACTFLTWKTSRWQSCTYLTNKLAKTEPQNVGQIWKLIQIASLHIHGQTTQVCQVSLGEIPWHIRWKIQQIFQVLSMQLASCFTFRKGLSSLVPSWIV